MKRPDLCPVGCELSVIQIWQLLISTAAPFRVASMRPPIKSRSGSRDRVNSSIAAPLWEAVALPGIQKPPRLRQKQSRMISRNAEMSIMKIVRAVSGVMFSPSVP